MTAGHPVTFNILKGNKNASVEIKKMLKISGFIK